MQRNRIVPEWVKKKKKKSTETVNEMILVDGPKRQEKISQLILFGISLTPKLGSDIKKKKKNTDQYPL